MDSTLNHTHSHREERETDRATDREARKERDTHTHQQEQPRVDSTTWHSKGERDTESLESTEKTMADYETTRLTKKTGAGIQCVYDTLSTLSITSTCVLYYSTLLLQSVEPLKPLE